MPFIELQKLLGIDIDEWNLSLSSKQANQQAAKCNIFEKEWLECADNIGKVRAEKECRLEKEDLQECLLMEKLFKRMKAINEQRSKLIKEGKYTPPAHHRPK